MKNKQFNELAVCGLEAVLSLGKNNAHLITRLYFTENRASQFGALCKKLAGSKKPYNMVKDVQELEKLCGSVHHDGVVAMIARPSISDANFPLIQACAKESRPILILDRISNANNFGAIVRSSAFFGVKTIIISKEEAQTSITTSTYRIAKGGMDDVKVYTTESIPRLLGDLEDSFVTVGTDVRTNIILQNLSQTLEEKKLTGKPLAIVLGNEEKGIDERVKNACKILVRIAGCSRSGSVEGDIESLNVAQAASVLLYEVTK